MRALALMGAIWAGSMLLIGAAGFWFTATGAFALMAVAVVAFAIGECLHGIVHGPLTADLAPPALVGRYMAFGSQSWQVGWIIGPADRRLRPPARAERAVARRGGAQHRRGAVRARARTAPAARGRARAVTHRAVEVGL